MTYFQRIIRGGPKAFWRRLRGSHFGLTTIRRESNIFFKRRHIVSRERLRQSPKVYSRSELQALLGVPALINDAEIAVFEKYSPKAQDIIVEIGCAYGGSSLLFLMNKNDSSRVYSIDPFIKDSMGDFQATQDLCYGHVTKAMKDLELLERIKQWTLVPEYSYDYVKKWQQPIDVLFIDGDHRYEAVKQDFEDWFKFIRPGGIVFFHDSCRPTDVPEQKYDHGWPGPSQLVKELSSDNRLRLIEQVYSISVFEKQ